MKSAIEIFAQLGERLASFGHDAVSQSVIAAATADNEWFTADEIICAAESVRSEMLQRDKLQAWLARYDFSRTTPKRVAIIMAGNIPFVGFFDLLCVLAAGHRAIVKPSAKDRVLMRHIIGLLREIEPKTTVEEVDDDGVSRVRADAVIATGSDNSNRYFNSLFRDIPKLLRGNRHSVAVLSGNETDEDMRGLQSDIFLYSGLGCRNVSMIFTPRGHGLYIGGSASNPKYGNNYLQNRALMTMAGEQFRDTGSCLLVSDDEFPAAISRVAVVEYDSLDEVRRWLAAHDGELQCVVTQCLEHSRAVPFGMAQRPRLTDYPDDKDVLAFLAGL